MQAAKRFALIVSVILVILLVVGLILAAIFKVLTDVFNHGTYTYDQNCAG